MTGSFKVKWWATNSLSELFALDLYITDTIEFFPRHSYKNKDFLHEYLVEKGHSPAYIAANIGCSRQSVTSYALLYGIPIPKDDDSSGRQNISYGKRRVNGVVVEHLGEQRIVRRVLDLRKSGFTLLKIATYLNKQGVPTKKNGSKWFPMSVLKVVKKYEK